MPSRTPFSCSPIAGTHLIRSRTSDPGYEKRHADARWHAAAKDIEFKERNCPPNTRHWKMLAPSAMEQLSQRESARILREEFAGLDPSRPATTVSGFRRRTHAPGHCGPRWLPQWKHACQVADGSFPAATEAQETRFGGRIPTVDASISRESLGLRGSRRLSSVFFRNEWQVNVGCEFEGHFSACRRLVPLADRHRPGATCRQRVDGRTLYASTCPTDGAMASRLDECFGHRFRRGAVR